MRKSLYYMSICIFLFACQGKNSHCRLKKLNSHYYVQKGGSQRIKLLVNGDNVIMSFKHSSQVFAFTLKDCELHGSGPLGNATILSDGLIFAGVEYRSEGQSVSGVAGGF